VIYRTLGKIFFDLKRKNSVTCLNIGGSNTRFFVPPRCSQLGEQVAVLTQVAACAKFSRCMHLNKAKSNRVPDCELGMRRRRTITPSLSDEETQAASK
jgi:hypothetical protein